MQTALAQALHRVDLFRAAVAHALQRVDAGVVHRRRQRHRRGQIGLDLIGAIAVLLQPQREVHHVLVGGAGMGGDEVGDEEVLLPRRLHRRVEQLLETVVGADARLHHLGERALLGVLGRDLQIAADVVGDEFLDVGRRLHRQVVAHARGDEDLLHARHFARLAVELDQVVVAGVQVLADVGEDAGRLAAQRFRLLVLAGHAPHVGGRAADVGDDAGEAFGLVADLADLLDDRLLRPRLDHPPLVLGDRAEGTAAETAAHDGDREADHLPGGDLGVAIGRMRRPGVGQFVDRVHLRRLERHRRRRQPQFAVAVTLHQRPGVAGVRFTMEHAGGPRIGLAIGRHLFEGGEPHHRRGPRLAGAVVGAVEIVGGDDGPALGHRRLDQGDAADVVETRRVLALGDAVGDVDEGAFGIAVEQDVGLGVDQDRAADLVGPVVVVRDAAQARLDAAEHDRHVLVGLAHPLRIDDDGAVRALAALAVGRVGVVVAQPLVGGVAVDHRVHVAAGDAEEHRRLAERAEGFGARPVGLGDDADAEALTLQHAADHRHAEARMVDIGVARHQDHVAGVPAERVHLGARHRQEGRGAETMGPVLAVGEEGSCLRHRAIHRANAGAVKERCARKAAPRRVSGPIDARRGQSDAGNRTLRITADLAARDPG